MAPRLSTLLCLWAMALAKVHAETGMEQPQRELARQSEGNAPEELNVDVKRSFDEQFMKEMQSSCRPEKDGYFGSTSGEPSRLTFGFRLETKPLSSIVDMLDLVEDRIVDRILSESFPQLCGFRRRQLSEARASGFRFLTLHESEKCNPSVGGFNFCGVFTGQVNVYGYNRARATGSVMEMIKEALTVNDASAIHKDMAALSAEDGRFALGEEPDNDNANVVGYVCFALAALVLAGIFYWKCVYGRKQGDTGYSNRRNRGFFSRFFSRGYDDYDPSEGSIMPNYEKDGISYARPLNAGSYERPIAVGFSDAGSVYSDYTDHDLKLTDPELI